jgi:hypothetical protein
LSFLGWICYYLGRVFVLGGEHAAPCNGCQPAHRGAPPRQQVRPVAAWRQSGLKALAHNAIALDRALDELTVFSRRGDRNHFCKSVAGEGAGRAVVVELVNRVAQAKGRSGLVELINEDDDRCVCVGGGR